MTINRVPWSLLTPGTFPDHADDIAEHYAREFAALADGEARWLLNQISTGDTGSRRMVRSVVARALVRAAIKLEAEHDRRALALGNEAEA